MSFLLIPLFAALYRCRGGFLGTGHTQLGRVIYWAFPVGVWALFQNFVLAPDVALMAFLGLLIPHSEYQANAFPQSVVAMAIIGMARLMLILAPFSFMHPLILIYAPIGALSGAAYYIGWKYLNGIDSHISAPSFTLFGIQFAGGKFAVQGCEWGEVLTGAAFGIAFALAGL